MHQLGLPIAIAAIVIVYIVFSRVTTAGIKWVNAGAAQDLIKQNDVLLLDVRTSQEFRSGHIKGAKLLPVLELESRVGEIADWKDRQIVVYCHSGTRSAKACRILKKNGFVKLANLNGGILSWKSMGYKTV
jgi:rhodanese-related sulfurtransferase